MRHQRSTPVEPAMETRPSSASDIDYTPKELSGRQTVLLGLKYLAVAGIIVILFWVLEKYLF